MSSSTYQENTPTASTFPMKKPLTFDLALMWSVRRWGMLGLLLALAVTLGSREVASAATLRTINLNTGYDQLNDLLIPVGQRDNEWRVTSPPLNGDAAFVVNNIAWANQNPNFLLKADGFPLTPLRLRSVLRRVLTRMSSISPCLRGFPPRSS